MIDTKPIMDQVYKFQNTVNQMAKERSKVFGSILVASIIPKLPLSWKDHLKNVQRQKDESTLEDLWTLEDLEKMERKMHDFIVRNWATSKSTVSNIKEWKIRPIVPRAIWNGQYRGKYSLYWLGLVVSTGAVKYISHDCSCLKTYNEVEEILSFYMGNSSTAKIISRGIVDLRLISGEIPSLTIVLHVLEIH